MKKTTERCVEESWGQLQIRLRHATIDIALMLGQLHARRRAPRFRPQERMLGARLKSQQYWIDKVLTRRPTTPEQATVFVMSLYEFDLGRAATVDDFQRLLEETGELPSP